jgi:PAS domain S-box-containing protein
MAGKLSKEDTITLKLFRFRNRLLTAIREHSLKDLEEQNQSFIFQYCCDILHEAFDYTHVWAGGFESEQKQLILFAASPPATFENSSAHLYLAGILSERFDSNLESFVEPLRLYLDAETFDQVESLEGHCVVWPVRYEHRVYGFVTMHCRQEISFPELENEFIAHVIDDIALALFSHETALKLKVERDFNQEIIDTIQALLVSISPCGMIVSFNKRAEELTGYKEHDVLGKYWVDVLVNPHKRKEFQKYFTQILKITQAEINFRASLLAKDGTERHIMWHGSIRHDIEKSTVGLVMLGIDETDNLAAGNQIHKLTAQWEQIFNAIQDPVLLVSNDNTIIDANPATCATAKKKRHEVIGRNVCDILHHAHGDNSQGPLEPFIGSKRTRILEAELQGLQGRYMITISPLLGSDGKTNATLLIARNLTEEEVLRAETMRAAQLAAIGELASGVAHEINNPINGIINYAQIILDEPDDPDSQDNLQNIISEGKRIASIVSNLLDFARRREEVFTSAYIKKIVSNSLQLVAHLLEKDGIICSINIADSLPPLFCNEQQLQQVFLNLISNARYALNKRYPQPCPNKQLHILGDLFNQNKTPSIRLTFTDHGVGISAEVQEKIFDPFFSTKPKGEGTGLGLSISHGLIRDHGGTMKVQSKLGEWTQVTIELPVKP